MNTDKLLKTLPVLQQQLDSLLEFDCTANDLTNGNFSPANRSTGDLLMIIPAGVINMCFMLLFRDLIRLFACYNDAIINLLEKYFDMNKKQCRDALDLYKKFLTRMDRVGEFLKVAEVRISQRGFIGADSDVNWNSIQCSWFLVSFSTWILAEHRHWQRRYSGSDEGTELVAGSTRATFEHTWRKERLRRKHTNSDGQVIRRVSDYRVPGWKLINSHRA